MSSSVMLRYPTSSGCYKVKKTFMTFITTGNRQNKYYLSRQVIQHTQSNKNQIDGVVMAHAHSALKLNGHCLPHNFEKPETTWSGHNKATGFMSVRWDSLSQVTSS